MRQRSIAAIVAVAGAVALASALGGTAGAAPKATVTLGDNFFKPSVKRVKRGTKVRFKWVGDRPHNVTKRSGPGGSFSSRTTSARSVNFAKRFAKAGTYRLICTVHPTTMRMKLTVRR